MAVKSVKLISKHFLNDKIFYYILACCTLISNFQYQISIFWFFKILTFNEKQIKLNQKIANLKFKFFILILPE